jgi:hypothetical protein
VDLLRRAGELVRVSRLTLRGCVVDILNVNSEVSLEIATRNEC